MKPVAVRMEPFDLLDSLGGSAEIVAARLKAEGMFGIRESCIACPVANFLRSEGVRVVGICELGLDYIDGPIGMRTVKLPPAITRFIREFDKGLFPQLDIPAHKASRRAVCV